MTSDELDALVKRLMEAGDFSLNPERGEEFIGCSVNSCPCANERVDRVVWYHFVEVVRDGKVGRWGLKLCVKCTQFAMAHPTYPAIVVCRVHIMLGQKVMKDVIRTGCFESHSDLGKRLEQEVLEESEKNGIN